MGYYKSLGKKLKEHHDYIKRRVDVAINDIATTTGQTLYESKDGIIKLNYMTGATEQTSYAGYQLFDASKLQTYSVGDATITNNNDGSFAISGTITDTVTHYHSYSHEETIKMLKAGSLYLNCEAKSMPNVYAQLVIDGSAKVELSNRTDISSNGKILQEYLDNETSFLRIGFYGSASMGTVTGTIRPMLYQDGDGTWEPFTGCQPSPSPEYQQSLNHTGNCVEMIQGRYSTTNGEYTQHTNCVCNKRILPCKAGDVLILTTENSCNHRFIFYSNGRYVGDNSSPNAVKTLSAVVPSDCNQFGFYLNDDYKAITPESVGKIELTVNGKYIGQIVEHGVNLLNPETLIAGDYNGTVPDLRVHQSLKDRKNVKKGEECTIAWDDSSLGVWVIVTDENNNILSRIIEKCYNSPTTFSVNEDGRLTVIFGGKMANIETGTWTKISLNQVKNAKPRLYSGNKDLGEPYQEHIETFYMDEPLRDGDRIVQIDDLWQVERNSAEVVLDKNSGWTNFEQGWVYTRPNNLKPSSKCISDRYIDYRYKPESVNVVDNIITTNRGSEIVVFIKDTTHILGSDLIAWFAYLDENPITVEYELATPTYEVLDNQSQIALNSLKSFNGVTYVEIDSRVQPQEVSFDYGTSHVGARVIKAENDNLIEKVKRQELEAKLEELQVALLALAK